MLVAVLGPVIVVVGGEAKSVDVAKHRAVLSTLALHGGRVVDTSELIDAIWGDDPPATAAKTLQGYVSALRKQFGPDLVATEPGGYRLGDAVDDVDVTEFEHAIDLGRDHLDGGRPDAAVRAFRSALARWRGRPLVDLADGPVAAGHVARLDELRALARAGEIEGELASGHHREVVPELERLVREYPYREHLWRLLMLALYRSGRAAEAIDAFERARAILANDLGVDPSAPTSALRRRIGEHDSSLDAPFVPPPTNLSARLDRFVGRDGERLRLTDEIERHRLVALVGVGGVGKSRLANEFARTALDRFPGGVWWVDLATSDVATSVAALTAAAMDVQSGHRVEPALAATLRRAPTLLIIDNCEHRAEDVARFVTWVTSEVDTVRILATSRLRLDVIGCRHIVVEPLDTTGPDSGAVELFLDRVNDRGGTVVDPDDAGRIAELVGGLPLGLELAAAHCVTLDARELIDRLGAGGALLEMTDPRRSERHASLGRVLDAGLRVLDDDVRSCVSLLSVLPGDFDLAVASTVMDVGRPRAEDVLRQAIDASVLARAPSRHEGARYRILWPVRQHLDEQLTDAERDLAAGRHAAHVRRFAARYRIVADTDLEAAWTERAAEDDADLRAAFAWYEHHDAEGAIVIATAASRAAWQRGDQRDAARVLGGALDRASSAPAELVAWATEAVCWPEFLSGQIDRALAHSREAIERFEVLGDARGLARALRNQAHALHLGGVDAEVTTPMYRRSIEVALTAGSSYGAAVSQVQYAHALTAFEEFDVDDIEPMLDEACAVLREAGDRTTLAHAELSRVFLAFARGDVEGTRAAAEEMMRLSRLSRSLIWQQIAAVALGVNAFERGDEGARRRHFADAVRWAVETDNEVQLGIALWSLAPTLARSDPTTAARLWGAARARSPLPPLHRRRYGPWIDDARTRLGERFADLEDEGSRLTTAEVVAMCEPSG